jgi:SAM-dependent methyltransferase
MASVALRTLFGRLARSRMGERVIRRITAPPVGDVNWSTLRRTMPVSRWFGCERGIPLDRLYIEQFLRRNAEKIRGHVLEVSEDRYTRRFGADRVESCDILHVMPGNPVATVVADLADAPAIRDRTYDCVVITQTLQMIYNLPAAMQTLHRILKPGGAVLATVPGISQISRSDMEQWGDFWRFTTASATRLFTEAFPTGKVDVSVYGNVLVASAFLYGLASEDLTDAEIGAHDLDYQLLIGVCAVKNQNTGVA